MAICSLDCHDFSTMVVEKLNLDAAPASRLKALGVFEGQEIELTRKGNPFIIKAAGSRVAIAADIAKCILVRDPEE